MHRCAELSKSNDKLAWLKYQIPINVNNYNLFFYKELNRVVQYVNK